LTVSDGVRERASRTRILLMDVDGVLTDGRYWNVPDGRGGLVETKAFDSQDGIALHWLGKAGIRAGLISGRVSPATEERARQARFAWIFQGHVEKVPLLERVLAESSLGAEQVAYVGDDFTDAPIFRRVGLAVATANARPEVKPLAHHVTVAPGGQGAVREVVELLLRAQGRWREVLSHYGLPGEG
jgi:3-deoxy-D-manno-octulosonate 8-phosphate phosphatase (KDO 8-P phosphatase)